MYLQVDFVKYHLLIKISYLIYMIIADKSCRVYFSNFLYQISCDLIKEIFELSEVMQIILL